MIDTTQQTTSMTGTVTEITEETKNAKPRMNFEERNAIRLREM